MDKQKVCAVIVSYNSPESVVTCVDSVCRQVAEIVVVDNSSDVDLRQELRNGDYPDGVSFIYNETNKGLGIALNQGIRYSLARNYEWTLLLDQDSVPSDHMIEEMMHSYKFLSDAARKKTALIVPAIYEMNFEKPLPPIITTNFLNKKIKTPSEDTFVHFQITSGMLIRNNIFEDVGMMNEYFFIDYIDFDYCFRVLNKRYKILLSKKALLYHRLAEKKKRLGFSFREHQPRRVYYQTRNRLITLAEYGNSYKSFLYSEAVRLFCKFLKIVFIESNKKEKIGMYFLGIRDFVNASRGSELKT